MQNPVIFIKLYMHAYYHKFCALLFPIEDVYVTFICALGIYIYIYIYIYSI